MSKYAVIVYTDAKTGLSEKTFPKILRSVEEEIAMYERHMSSEDITFTMEVLKESYDELRKIHAERSFLIDSSYRPNPFNALLKPEKSHTVIIPKLPNDPKDCAWALTFNHDSEEKGWVQDMFNTFCDKIYSNSIKDPKTNDMYKIFGSLCHRGFVNHVFDYHHQSGMNEIRHYVEIIGSDKEKVINGIKTLSNKKTTNISDSNPLDLSIYKNGFYTSYVDMISRYCELMFGLDKYVVASHFEKNDPEIFMEIANKTKSKFTARYSMFKAGAIHAELGNYEKALAIFEQGNRVAPDEHGIFTDKIKKFREYYEKHETTVLSSHF